MEFEEEDDDQSRFEDIMYSSYLNPHPLLIPTIVKSILCEFSYAELKQYCFVCTNWEYEASSILKSKTQIRFPSASHVTNYITQLDENYCCDSYEFGPEIPISSCSMQFFFNLFGPDIKSLKLHQVQWTGPELWEILSSKLPYLEKLSVHIFIPRETNNFLPDTKNETTTR